MKNFRSIYVKTKIYNTLKKIRISCPNYKIRDYSNIKLNKI